MLTLEEQVKLVLDNDATFQSLVVTPGGAYAAGEVWTVPLDAKYPHVSWASATDGGGGPADVSTTRKARLIFWVESQSSRVQAKTIAARIEVLFHRQQATVSSSSIGIYMLKLSGAPVTLREPRTNAHQVTLEFEVTAQ